MILFSGREIALPKLRENDRLISRCPWLRAASARAICLQRILADFLIGTHTLRNGFCLLTLDDRLYHAAFPRLCVPLIPTNCLSVRSLDPLRLLKMLSRVSSEGQRSNEDRVRKNSAGVAMRTPVRFATAWVKCLLLCVSNQSGLLTIAERSMGTSAACRIRCRLDRTSA